MNRPTWDETWMEIAMVIKKRVTCIHHRIGAVIAKGQYLISIGYTVPLSENRIVKRLVALMKEA